MKKYITINKLMRSILGFTMILAGCTAIFVGVAGGYHSPLSASADPGVANAAGAATVHSLRAASIPGISP